MKRGTENLRHTRWECKYHVVFIPKYLTRQNMVFGECVQSVMTRCSAVHLQQTGLSRDNRSHRPIRVGATLLRKASMNWSPRSMRKGTSYPARARAKGSGASPSRAL